MTTSQSCSVLNYYNHNMSNLLLINCFISIIHLMILLLLFFGCRHSVTSLATKIAHNLRHLAEAVYTAKYFALYQKNKQKCISNDRMRTVYTILIGIIASFLVTETFTETTGNYVCLFALLLSL